MLIAGIDISTKRLDAALIPLDTDVPQTIVFRTEHLDATNDDGARYYAINEATKNLCRGGELASAFIEKPRGKYAVAQLNAVYGAVMASVPTLTTRAGIEPQEWRSILGLPRKLEKAEAIHHAQIWLDGKEIVTDEHQAEALLIALAGRDITWRHHQATA